MPLRIVDAIEPIRIKFKYYVNQSENLCKEHTYLQDAIREVQNYGRAGPEPCPEVRKPHPLLNGPLPCSAPSLQQVLSHVGLKVLQQGDLCMHEDTYVGKKHDVYLQQFLQGHA